MTPFLTRILLSNFGRVLAFLFFISSAQLRAQTMVTYTQQTGNNYSTWSTGTTGTFNQGVNQAGIFANGGGTKQVVSWRKFLTDAYFDSFQLQASASMKTPFYLNTMLTLFKKSFSTLMLLLSKAALGQNSPNSCNLTLSSGTVDQTIALAITQWGFTNFTNCESEKILL
jgi:hypothetical protein